MKSTRILLGLTVILGLAGAALAAEPTPTERAITARKALMDLMAFNLGQIGAMAKGQSPYDAAAAKAAAENLAKLSSLDTRPLWPKGSDDMSAEKTRALPAIWENTADFEKHFIAMHDSAQNLAGTAGTGIDALRAGLGDLGQKCGACHKLYRTPQQ